VLPTLLWILGGLSREVHMSYVDRALRNAEERAKKKKVDWSKIGRKSRRKGKSFECQLARILTANTGVEWITSRNSGRTDVPHDVFCPKHFPHKGRWVIEAKHRKNLTFTDVIKRNKSYLDFIAEMGGKEWAVLVFRKDQYGIWAGTNGQPRFLTEMFDHDVALKDKDFTWVLIQGWISHALRKGLLGLPSGEV
jgi:Holliday junction resolvase